MSCTRREVKTAHLLRVTQTHIFLVLRTRDSRAGHIINAHASAQEHVGCLSPRAHQKAFVPLMFRRALLDVPDPFPSFCSTPPPTQSSKLNTGMIFRRVGVGFCFSVLRLQNMRQLTCHVL